MSPRSGKLTKDTITTMRQVNCVQGLANLQRTISLQWNKIIESKIWQTHMGQCHYKETRLLSPRSGKLTKDTFTTMRQDYWVQGLANLHRTLSLQCDKIIESKVWKTHKGQYHYNETRLLSPSSYLWSYPHLAVRIHPLLLHRLDSELQDIIAKTFYAVKIEKQVTKFMQCIVIAWNS